MALSNKMTSCTSAGAIKAIQHVACSLCIGPDLWGRVGGGDIKIKKVSRSTLQLHALI